MLASVFIAGYIMTVCGCALLLRYSEGATLPAIVMVSYILSGVLTHRATLLSLLENILYAIDENLSWNTLNMLLLFCQPFLLLPLIFVCFSHVPPPDDRMENS